MKRPGLMPGRLSVAPHIVAVLVLAAVAAGMLGGCSTYKAQDNAPPAQITWVAAPKQLVIEVHAVKGINVPTESLDEVATRIGQITEGRVHARWYLNSTIPADDARRFSPVQLEMLYADGPESTDSSPADYLHILLCDSASPWPEDIRKATGMVNTSWPCGVILNMSKISHSQYVAPGLMHEIGHAYGLAHCPNPKCLMNETPPVRIWRLIFGAKAPTYWYCDKCRKAFADAIVACDRKYRGPALLREEPSYIVVYYPAAVIMVPTGVDIDYDAILSESRSRVRSVPAETGFEFSVCNAESTDAAVTMLKDAVSKDSDPDVRGAAAHALELLEGKDQSSPPVESTDTAEQRLRT